MGTINNGGLTTTSVHNLNGAPKIPSAMMLFNANYVTSQVMLPMFVALGLTITLTLKPTTKPHNMATYNGLEEATMGDGNKIPITHTGSTQLHASNTAFKLSNTLCAVDIKRNLISVSKFCQDNLTSVEFFPYDFYVKNLQTRMSLVHGRSKDGLYEWPPISSQTSPRVHMASSNVLVVTWHRTLGHPHAQVLQFLLNNFSLPFSAQTKFTFCNSCSSNKAHRQLFKN